MDPTIVSKKCKFSWHDEDCLLRYILAQFAIDHWFSTALREAYRKARFERQISASATAVAAAERAILLKPG
jgi:hypothetical protein